MLGYKCSALVLISIDFMCIVVGLRVSNDSSQDVSGYMCPNFDTRSRCVQIYVSEHLSPYQCSIKLGVDPVFGFSMLNYYSNRVNVRDLFSFAVYWKPLI